MTDDIEEQQYQDCPVCKQDVLMLVGTGRYFKCGTCGYYVYPEVEEP